MRKLKTILLGMTGFGNNAFKVLAGSYLVDLKGVFSPAGRDELFPHYPCVSLRRVVTNSSIKFYEIDDINNHASIRKIEKILPDLIVVSSFSQIIHSAIIRIPQCGIINIHPSLLPRYRGATPTYWVLVKGEKKTGVTVHFIEDQSIDSGRIIVQAPLWIPKNDTDGMLRFRLAKLSERVLRKAVRLVAVHAREDFKRQDEAQASCYPKRGRHSVCIDLNQPFTKIHDQIRALLPFPGACIMHNGMKYSVTGITKCSSGRRYSSVVPGRRFVIAAIKKGCAKFTYTKVLHNGH